MFTWVCPPVAANFFSLVRRYPCVLTTLTHFINQPWLSELIRHFLYNQINPEALICGSDIDLLLCPDAPDGVMVYPSTVATFYALSDWSSASSMKHKRICSVASWCSGPTRQDCVFLNGDNDLPGFCGLHTACILLLFSFKYGWHITFPCMLVSWFTPVDDKLYPETGM